MYYFFKTNLPSSVYLFDEYFVIFFSQLATIISKF